MIFTKKEQLKSNEITEGEIPIFGYKLLKEDLLPDLLGKEHNSILYWAGKSLARKYPAPSFDDIILFFKKAGWGELLIVKEKRSEVIFELTSNLFNDKKELSTPLEAGFLAQQVESIKGGITETNEMPKNGKIKKIIYHVKWDLHDKVDNEQ
ncbi:hypothetical protein BKP35_14670 [Anaerobacillus arseniciselenatis]|uniref:DUF2507 domain-containing protein n=1 Tax=Anaerobacillus arseniciselenatis TaxID=85682 RepID=A0A1S2LFQ6_9BACI|nr:YslB family protein [Anaerobacillus arseniciselenatis]OIJ10335.1 hypothetical protein BKP35_14670 [Anaerobacillus arseniciselenatis]